MKKSLKLQSDEQGFAAIVIALILVLVLALLTVGFAQLARREQQGALDKLFANQAFYAAESGINDVQKLISSGATLPTSTGCQTLPNKDISTHGASYSCVIVNEEPPTLEYSSVESSQSKAVVFNTAAPINSIKIEWKSTNPAFSALKITAPGVFTPEPDWNSPKKSMAVLQIGLTDLSTVTRDALINNTFNTYGYPSSSALGTTPYVASNQANVVAADCSGSDYRCSLTITGLPANSNGFLLRMLDLYTTSDIRISAYASPSPAQVPLRGAQALVDSTGKSRDVLKRLQVRIPLNNLGGNLVPNFAIQAGDLCKRIATIPGAGNNTYVDPNDGTTPSPNAACDLDQ